MGDSVKLTEREARRWVREHWADFIHLSDCPCGAPEEAANLWDSESKRIAARIAGRAALTKDRPDAR